MNVEFNTSRTKENLMRAFAGESQARNRYTFAAEQALNQNLQSIHKIFLFTANQELAHAKVYYDLLKDSAGNNISVDGNYPIDIYDNVVQLLRSAEHNEMQEYEHDYAEFSNIAREEGFIKISNTFKNIADVEKTHSDRFKEMADLMEAGKLFVADSEIEWMCLNCGYVYKGTKVPEKCPVCTHDKGYFIRLTLAPYTNMKS